MVSYDVIKEELVPMVKARDILKKIKEKGFEQKMAYEHTKKFTKIEEKEATELIKELIGLDMRKLKEELIIKIVDVFPQDINALKVILMNAPVPFKDDETQKIFDIVKKYGGKKK